MLNVFYSVRACVRACVSVCVCVCVYVCVCDALKTKQLDFWTRYHFLSLTRDVFAWNVGEEWNEIGNRRQEGRHLRTVVCGWSDKLRSLVTPQPWEMDKAFHLDKRSMVFQTVNKIYTAHDADHLPAIEL